MQQMQDSGYLEGGIETIAEDVLGREHFVFRRRKRARDITGMLGIIRNELWTQTRNRVWLHSPVQGT